MQLKPFYKICLLASLGLSVSSIKAAQHGVERAEARDEAREEAQVSEEIKESTRQAKIEAARLLVYLQTLQQSGVLETSVQVPEDIKEKYNMARSSVLGGSVVPTAALIGTGALVKESFEHTKSVSDSINQLIAMLKPGVVWSSEQLEKIYELAAVEWSSDVLGRSSEQVWKSSLEPAFKLLFNQYTGYAAGASSGSGALALSSVLVTNDANEIMTKASARKLLGQDKAMSLALDKALAGPRSIYNMADADYAKFKEAVAAKMLERAISNKFKTKDRDGNALNYKVDFVKVMADERIGDPKVVLAAQKLQESFNPAVEYRPRLDDLSKLKDRVGDITASMAVMDTILKEQDGRLGAENEAQIRQMKANAQRTLDIIQSNLVD